MKINEPNRQIVKSISTNNYRNDQKKTELNIEKVVKVTPITASFAKKIQNDSNGNSQILAKNLLPTKEKPNGAIGFRQSYNNDNGKKIENNENKIFSLVQNPERTLNFQRNNNSNIDTLGGNTLFSNSRDSRISSNSAFPDSNISAKKGLEVPKNKGIERGYSMNTFNTTKKSDKQFENNDLKIVKSISDENENKSLIFLDKNESNILLEDFIKIDGLLSSALNNLKNQKNIVDEYVEYWDYYNNSLLRKKIDFLFQEIPQNKKGNVMRDANVLELLTFVLVYESCFHSNFQLPKISQSLVFLVYQNFLIIVEFFVSNHCSANVVLHKIYNLAIEKLDMNIKLGEEKAILRKNNNSIFNTFKDLLGLLDSLEIIKQYSSFLENFSSLKSQQIKDYFTNKIQRKIIKNDDKLKSFSISVSPDSNSNLNIPQKQLNIFILKKPLKKYTLLLDLDETLIHLEFKKDADATLTFRPGLYEFLDEISKYYELIIFTCGTQEYADPIIDKIESQKKYFDYRLFRDHNLYQNGEYIKDLSKVGRDLSKTLIIDNLYQNFRLQKENGILIKSFYSDSLNDSSLIELIPILKKIYEANPSDIRKELVKYKNDLLKILTNSGYPLNKFALSNKLIK